MTQHSPNRTPAAQRLRVWLDEQPHLHREVADVLGVTRSALSMWATGSRRPAALLRAKLERLTDGRVRVGDWLTAEEVAEVHSVRGLG